MKDENPILKSASPFIKSLYEKHDDVEIINLLQEIAVFMVMYNAEKEAHEKVGKEPPYANDKKMQWLIEAFNGEDFKGMMKGCAK